MGEKYSVSQSGDWSSGLAEMKCLSNLGPPSPATATATAFADFTSFICLWPWPSDWSPYLLSYLTPFSPSLLVRLFS